MHQFFPRFLFCRFFFFSLSWNPKLFYLICIFHYWAFKSHFLVWIPRKKLESVSKFLFETFFDINISQFITINFLFSCVAFSSFPLFQLYFTYNKLWSLPNLSPLHALLSWRELLHFMDVIKLHQNQSINKVGMNEIITKG